MSKDEMLKKELFGTLSWMNLIDNEFNWQDIKDEINFGVTSLYEITEIVLHKLDKWLENEENNKNERYDFFNMCYNELLIVWDKIND